MPVDVTQASIVKAVRYSLGFNTALEEEYITDTLDRVQSRYENGQDDMQPPWFNLVVDAEITTTAGQRQVALPADFITFDDDWPLVIMTADDITKPLIRSSQANLVKYSDLTGFPERYEYSAGYLYCTPKPDDAYTIKVTYYKRSELLSESDTSPWYNNFMDLLVEETAHQIAKYSRDKSFLQMSEVVAKRAEYLRRNEAQKHILKQYGMGWADA